MLSTDSRFTQIRCLLCQRPTLESFARHFVVAAIRRRRQKKRSTQNVQKREGLQIYGIGLDESKKDHKSAAATPPPSSRTGEMSSDSRFKSFLTRGVSDMRSGTKYTRLCSHCFRLLFFTHFISNHQKPPPALSKRAVAS
jgi:hypothetical protein